MKSSKRTVFLLASIVVTFVMLAQTQQGYVKTIGRPNSPGTSLSGVTVRVSGNLNAVITNQQGVFSFPIKDLRFKFSRVSKNGYELADHDFLHYDFGVSPNVPITVAMVSKEELQKERDIIEEQTRQKLTKRFEEQNAILEQKLERKDISEEEFKNQLLALKDKFDNIDTLVSVLSDRYARTDYDNIDSTRLAINQHIENGELEYAQQLILSKGNIDERIRKLGERRILISGLQQEEKKLKENWPHTSFSFMKYQESSQNGTLHINI